MTLLCYVLCLEKNKIKGFNNLNEGDKKIQDALKEIQDQKIVEILRQMLSFDPSKRPSYTDILEQLKN